MNGGSESCQYLTFKLDQELYALDTTRVREVLEFNGVTKVPRTPEFMRGVINLRGSVVPVIDMRLKLGFRETEKTVDTCVVITEVNVAGESVVLGVLTDSVQEVIELDESQIVPPPQMGTGRIDGEVIRGMGRRDESFLIILDIDRVFTPSDVHVVSMHADEEAHTSET